MFLVKSIAYDPVVWSLSIEFSYYLLAPFLARLNTRTIFAMIVVSGLAYVAFKVGDSGFLLHAINKCNPLKYLWAWLLGFVCFRDQRPVVLVAVAVVGAPLVALANEDSLALVTFGLSYLLLNASGKLPSGHFQKNVMNYLGDLSYPMYLVHFPCFVICVFLVGISNVWIFVVLTLLATVLSYHLVDIYLKRIVFVPMINEVIRRWGSGLELIFSRGGVLNKPH
jgi:peptidoglycan/LPS O-acetylase OafA/YrhL